MKECAFFIGCTISAALPHIEMIARKVLPLLDISLRDFAFSCCPNSDFRSTDEESWLLVAARNLALAEKEGLDILCLCPGCTQTLKETKMILKNDESLRIKINKRLEKIDLVFKGIAEINHHLVLLQQQIDMLCNRIAVPLYGIKFAVHTGCHLIMPSRVMQFDNPEQPHKLEELVEILGAQTVDFKSLLLMFYCDIIRRSPVHLSC